MTTFDDATAVTRRGDGRYDTQADPRFAMVLAPGSGAPHAVNGGVLMATVLRAVLDAAPNPYPVATSANFLRVPKLGPAEVEVTWLKTGRTASIARAALVQDGVPVVDMSVTTGMLPDRLAAAGNGAAADGESLSWTGKQPLFPAIADCIDLGKWPGTDGANGISGFAAQLEVLLDPSVAGWRGDQPSGLPEMRGYVRLREHRDPDALMLALAVDALPPVVFGLGATGWAPTVELTWHMRAVPAAGPLRVAARSRHVSGGWFDEEVEVWDSAGQLVAQSRQLARVGRGRLRPADQLQAVAEAAAPGSRE
jgi:acyl-coenzyme A thioesterase PaaI-like protein